MSEHLPAGALVCHVLGLEPARVRSIILEAQAGQPLMAHVDMLVGDAELEALLPVLRRFELVERPEIETWGETAAEIDRLLSLPPEPPA